MYEKCHSAYVKTVFLPTIFMDQFNLTLKVMNINAKLDSTRKFK